MNRRGYPGSTPLSNEQFHNLDHGGFEERGEILRTIASEILLLVDTLIKKYNLPPLVTIAAWSLGNAILSAMLCIAPSTPPDVQERIKSHIKGIVLWGE